MQSAAAVVAPVAAEAEPVAFADVPVAAAGARRYIAAADAARLPSLYLLFAAEVAADLCVAAAFPHGSSPPASACRQYTAAAAAAVAAAAAAVPETATSSREKESQDI